MLPLPLQAIRIIWTRPTWGDRVTWPLALGQEDDNVGGNLEMGRILQGCIQKPLTAPLQICSMACIMKAKLIGFEWQFGHGVALDQLVTKLRSLRDEKVKLGSYDRLVYVCKVDSYHAGLFLTVKDQRKFAEVAAEGGRYQISVRDVEEGKNVVDFNFFAIHERTCRGVYLHYHQSCSLNQFSYFCKRVYNELKLELIAQAIEEAGGDNALEADIKLAKRKFRGSLKWATMVRQENLPQLLDELDRIRSFSFDFFAVGANIPVFTPYDDTARRMSHRVSFKSGLSLHRIKQAILRSIREGNLGRGRVEGKAGEIDRVIKLTDNPDCFAEYDHDHIADQMDVDLGDLASSWGVQQLISVAKRNPALFETPMT